MSGRIVPVIGGPLDGREFHRELSTGGGRDVRTYYVAGHPTGQVAPVHVYASQGSRNAPFRYEGVRARQPDDPAPFTLDLAAPTGEEAP